MSLDPGFYITLLLSTMKLMRLIYAVPEVIACLEVDGNGRVWKVLQVDGQDLLGDVVVVQLVVAEGNVHIQGQVFAIVQQNALVNVDGFLHKNKS